MVIHEVWWSCGSEPPFVRASLGGLMRQPRQLSVVLVSGLLTDTGLPHVCNVLTRTYNFA
jgi:hypothetical protein